MKDESFHLTPLDIRRYDFGNALRGYDKQRVEQFREQVAHEVERLVRQCQDLEAKARGFHEQLKAFRDRDKALNEALVSAQQLRAEMREQAEREAQLILREARAEGERIIEEARAGTRRLEAELEALVRQRRAYLAQLRTMIERHLAEVQAAEAAPVTLGLASPTDSPPVTPVNAAPVAPMNPVAQPTVQSSAQPAAQPAARPAGQPAARPAAHPAAHPAAPAAPPNPLQQPVAPELLDGPTAEEVGPRDATETPPWLRDLVKE